MPSKSHHVACFTDDPDAVHAYLTEVLGMPEHLRFHIPGDDLVATAGWPPNGGTEAVMYGTQPAGLVEVIAIPEELRAVVRPGPWLVSFAAPDIDARIDAARGQGLEHTEPYRTVGDVRLTASFTTVGGIPFELVRFDG
jgi:catechol 2,3-dioxygenase-like lactoylglutathione lyase family enzyme